MIVNMREGMRFGVGMDALTEGVRAQAIEFDREDNESGGQRSYPSIKLIESQQAFMETLNISVGASIQYGLASVDAKMQLAQSQAVNAHSLYVLLKVQVINPKRFMVNPRLTQPATDTYGRDAEHAEQFRVIYGDHYIDEIYSGGEFYGLFTFETMSESSHSELSASLRASVGGFFVGGEITASFQNTVDQFRSKTNMTITALMDGGAGLQNPTNLDELKDIYRTFNHAVQDHPIDFQASLKDYRYLPLPSGGTSLPESLVREDTVEKCGEYVIEALADRSTVDFILRYPAQFEPHDPQPLIAYRTALNERLPRWGRRATSCTNNSEQCGFADDEQPPPRPIFPKRLVSEDPLAEKWVWIMDHDDVLKQYFDERYLNGRSTKDDWQPAPDGGRYILFNVDGVEHPCAGLFHHPRLGTFGVAHTIFDQYWTSGGPFGAHGYPIDDEAFITNLDGLQLPSGEARGGWRRQKFQFTAKWRPDAPPDWPGGYEADNLIYRLGSEQDESTILFISVWEDGPFNPPSFFQLWD